MRRPASAPGSAAASFASGRATDSGVAAHQRREPRAEPAVGAERQAPSAGCPPEQPLGEIVVERHPGTAGERAEPSRLVDERAQRLALARVLRQTGQFPLRCREQAVERRRERALRRVEHNALALDAGDVAAQPHLAPAVDRGDPRSQASHGPAGQPDQGGGAMDEVPPQVRPAESQHDRAAEQSSQPLLGAVPVPDDHRLRH